MPIEFHRNMLADKPRNDAFYRALKSVIKKNKTIVADLGSGTGLLGFMASKLGAKTVYMYESADVIGLSQKLAKDNKIKNCHFIHEYSTAIIDPPEVDLVVSETLGNYAFEEHMIATLQDAKRFLKPGGVMIPQRVEQFVAPVVSPRFFDELTIWDDVGYGLDFAEAKRMGLNNIYVRTFGQKDLLDGGKAAKCWDKADFSKKTSNNRKGKTNWKLDKQTTIYGFAVWWNCELLPGIELSTSPDAPKTHWEQLYFPVLEPLKLNKGDSF